MLEKIWPLYWKCFLICKQRKHWHLKRSLHHLRYRFRLCPTHFSGFIKCCIFTLVTSFRIILPGWLPQTTLFVFIVRYLSQLKVVTSLIFCWATEDTYMVDTQRQLNLISGSQRYFLIIPVLGMYHVTLLHISFCSDLWCTNKLILLWKTNGLING